ncbi:ATP-binding protein, partial [bacterium]
VEDYYIVEIKDNGVGIKDTTIDKLFKIEEQISTPGTMKESGTGLGLLLCKEFIDINRGDIWVESVYGVGTSFKFSIPKSISAKYVSKEVLQQHLKSTIL